MNEGTLSFGSVFKLEGWPKLYLDAISGWD